MKRIIKSLMTLAVLGLLQAPSSIAQAKAPTVTISTGSLFGVIEKSFSGKEYVSFKGIPYAEPPIGELRFKAPVDKKPWQGTLNATQDGEACIQLYQFNEAVTVGSENCLLLNVYTKNLITEGEKELKPVVFHIHGGRFLVGSASSKVLSPIYMMDQDVVLVVIQYRLGALGFFSTNDSAAPGNYGFLDQVKALQWVQKNIAFFGGDRNRVIVSGQSAGGASAHLHVLSPLSKGLLSGAFALSGTGANYWASRCDFHQLVSVRQATAVGCPITSSEAIVECLKNIDAKVLTLSQSGLHDYFGGTPAKLPLMPFGPRIDSDSETPFIPVSGLDTLRSGDFQQIPVVMGVTSQEGAWFAAVYYGEDDMTRLKMFDSDYMNYMISLGTWTFSVEEIERWSAFYLDNKPLADPNQTIPFSEFFSDMTFNYEVIMAAYFHARNSKAPVFYYHFNYQGLWSFAEEFEESKHDYGGVAHVDDLRYLFRMPYGPELSEEEIEVMKRYTGYLAEFARTGRPTNNLGTKQDHLKWEPYQTGNGQYMKIDTLERSGMSKELPFETSERPGRMNFWRELYGYPEDYKEDFPTKTRIEL